jgi:hypothetical protein
MEAERAFVVRRSRGERCQETFARVRVKSPRE